MASLVLVERNPAFFEVHLEIAFVVKSAGLIVVGNINTSKTLNNYDFISLNYLSYHRYGELIRI